MPVVGGPPFLRCRHHGINVLFQSCQVECLERLRVVEILPQWIGCGWILVEHLQVQLIRPPLLVRYCASCVRVVHHGALTFVAHTSSYRVLRCNPPKHLFEKSKCISESCYFLWIKGRLTNYSFHILYINIVKNDKFKLGVGIWKSLLQCF